MIKDIKFNAYKKLKDITISFDKGLNAISGENGTCKSSLLYLISNSFQAVTSNCEWVKNNDALSIIRAVNANVNTKVESLQRGDQHYNDPANGVPGTLYTVDYLNGESLQFRRHNSRKDGKSRYSLKLYYPRGQKETLPFCPVVYLGLSRLIPYGEFDNDKAVKNLNKNLPDSFVKSIAENFNDFTGYDITQNGIQKLGDIKRRSEFTSTEEGVDSNTVSAGEDNLYIILSALESLKYYYENIDSKNEVESILLIDEVDASLHPDFQIRLLKLMREYAVNYKIQIIFTTHSLTTLEDLLEYKNKVIYLVNNDDHVTIMENATIQEIKAHLYNRAKDDIYSDKCIPIFTEDKEARVLIKMMFDFFDDTRPEFRNVRRFFSIPDITIGSDTLRSLFSDEKLLKSRVGAFCILDGDKNGCISDCIITLPGKNGGVKSKGLSPENLLLEYANQLAGRADEFWDNQIVIKEGFSKSYYREHIVKQVEKYEQKPGSVKQRDFNKKLFNNNIKFFNFIFKRWLHDDNNKEAIDKFYEQLKTMFKKCAEIRGISPLEWK